jgi:hypothetical protein
MCKCPRPLVSQYKTCDECRSRRRQYYYHQEQPSPANIPILPYSTPHYVQHHQLNLPNSDPVKRITQNESKHLLIISVKSKY